MRKISLLLLAVTVAALPALGTSVKAIELQNTPYTFTTFNRVEKLTSQTATAANGKTFSLNTEVNDFTRLFEMSANFDGSDLPGEGDRPICYVPKDLRLTWVAVATPDVLSPETITLDVNGTSYTLTRDAGNSAKEFYLMGAGGAARAYRQTYTPEGPITIQPDSTLSFNFNQEGDTTNYNLWLMDRSDAAGGRFPYVELFGHAGVCNYVITIDSGVNPETHGESLHALLTDSALDPAFTDAPEKVVVIDFVGEGGGINMDYPLEKSPLVIGSMLDASRAHVHFTGKDWEGKPQTTPFKGPLTFRDNRSTVGETKAGGISLYGPDDSTTAGSPNVWQPEAFLQLCDVTLRTPLPTKGWFSEHTISIPAGRMMRIEIDQGTYGTIAEANLPNLAFGGAQSRLELAIPGNTAIPAKYQTLIKEQSGVLALDQAVTMDALALGGESTLLFTGGHASTITNGFTTTGARADIIVEQGATLTMGNGTYGATSTVFDVREGAKLNVTEALNTTTDGTNTTLLAAQGAAVNLTQGVAEGVANSTATLDVVVEGSLTTAADLTMLPAARRDLIVRGGTIIGTGTGIDITVASADGAEDEYVTIEDGATFESVTVQAATGGGRLNLSTGTVVENLCDFSGTVAGTGNVYAFTGTLGTVLLDSMWAPDSGLPGKNLKDTLLGWGDSPSHPAASKFHGAIGFTAGVEGTPKAIDFSNLTKLTSITPIFQAQNHQHITMRLDQFADAIVRWPDNPTGIMLTLIESGAYGGEIAIPHIPTEVEVVFGYLDETNNNEFVEREGGYIVTPSEDGVTDTVTWDGPHFTGQGAWIDIEFNGNTRNTGWFTLKDQDGENVKNGMLRGDEGTGAAEIMENAADFAPVAHPADEHGGLSLARRPYVSFGSLPSYPEEWSCALRFTAPSTANTCILAIGNNTRAKNEKGGVNAVVFATGATADTIVCYRFDGTNPTTEGAIVVLSSVKLPDIQHTPHVFSVVCDGRELTLYMDGAWLTTQNLPEGGWALGCGMQVGSQLGGKIENQSNDATQGVPWDFWKKAVPATDGVIDYLRFYKGALTDVAMTEMAEATPSVQDADVHARYVRHVGDDGDTTWVEDGEWQRQTWDGSAWVDDGDPVAEPAECSYLYIYVAEGDHALGVNVQRDTANLFYSPNRNYAALVVGPEPNNTAAGTLRLVPYGASGTGTGDERTDAIDGSVAESAWFTTEPTDTTGNRTGYQYGIIRFTGGAGDPITDEGSIAADFHGSAYLISGSISVTVEGEAAPPTDEEWDAALQTQHSVSRGQELGWGIWNQPNANDYDVSISKTFTLKYEAVPGQAVNLIADGGVAYFSKYANVVLTTPFVGEQTRTDTWKRHIGWYSKSTFIGSSYYVNQDWDNAVQYTAGTPNGTLEPKGDQTSTFQMVAGMSLTRGESAESVEHQLTGPVKIEGAPTLDDHVLGHPTVDASATDVWVPTFDQSHSAWRVFDITRDAPRGADNANGVTTGLFARAIQTPGRLFLDFTDAATQAQYQANKNFSAQKWYRYGYVGDGEQSGIAGMDPTEAGAEDYTQAVAFQIRLDEAFEDAEGIVSLVLDKNPKAKVQVFYVEESTASNRALTLTLTTGEGAEPLVIHKNVVAEARLDVSNGNTGKAEVSGVNTGNALSLRPTSTTRTPVHRGQATTGHGAYIVGATNVDWDFGAESSVPRLEVIPGAELTFTVGQDFRKYGTTLVAQGVDDPSAATPETKAWIHAVSKEPFLGTDVVLGQGAVFGFHADAVTGQSHDSEGVFLEGALTLTGSEATLRAQDLNPTAGRTPHFVAAEGIKVEPANRSITQATLVVEAAGETTTWHSHTLAMESPGAVPFGLRKTGAGTVVFDGDMPPTVTGKVEVQQGTLALTASPTTPVGMGGLHVEAGATLADTGHSTGDSHRLAIIPDGAVLSGGGTLQCAPGDKGGSLAFHKGATYVVKNGEALTVTGGFAKDAYLDADINVELPEGYQAGTAYLISGVDESALGLRQRFLPMSAADERWDSIAWVQNADGDTHYAAQPATIPMPQDVEQNPGTYSDLLVRYLIRQYQGNGWAYVGGVYGRTRGGTRALNATEISDALLCFSNISVFVESQDASNERTYIDATDLYVAYEFGVNKMEIKEIDGEACVVVEVAVQDAFAGNFPNTAIVNHGAGGYNTSSRIFFRLLDAEGNRKASLTNRYAADGTGQAEWDYVEVTDMTGATEGRCKGENGADSDVRYFRFKKANLDAKAGDDLIRLRPMARSIYSTLNPDENE